MTESATILMTDVSATPRRRVPMSRAVRAQWERWYPSFLGGVSALLVAWWNPPAKETYDVVKGIVGSTIDTAAILAGFQGTALGILLGILGTAPVAVLRRSNHFATLVRFHWWAILAMLCTVVVAIAVQGLQSVWTTDFGVLGSLVPAVLLGVVVTAACASLRVTRLMVDILCLPNLDESQDSH